LDYLAKPVPQLPLPLASQGWATISVNFTPPATLKGQDLNADNVFNSADTQLVYDNAMVYQGATTPEPLKYALAGVKVVTRPNQSVTVWIDNMRFFESEYEIDLANGVQKLETAAAWDADFQALETLGGVWEQTTGHLDGTIEAYVNDPVKTISEELSDIGIVTGYGAPETTGAAFGRAYGWLTSRWKYNAYESSYQVTQAQGIDHTRNGLSETALKIVLTGPTTEPVEGKEIAYFAQIATEPIAASGSGIYVMESYLATQAPFNTGTASRRVPEIRVVLQETKPNVLGNASGLIFGQGGLPDVGGDLPFNWFRAVTTMYSKDCESFRAVYQLLDDVGRIGAPIQVSTYNAPVFIDDISFFKVADDINHFDAELFGM